MYAYNEDRGQYDSKLILKRLPNGCPPDAIRLMGITHVDIYVPILKYVFGVAEIEGRCSLMSLYRLRPEFYDQPRDLNLLLERADKTAIHELAHTLGLTHCRDRHCVMFSSTHIENTDFKRLDFCPTCRELFRWYLDVRLAGKDQ
jgi:archaemetzincin